MIKQLSLIVLLISVAYVNSHSQIRFGAVFGMGRAESSPGGGINSEFFVHKKLAISPGILIFKEQEMPTMYVSRWELNTNFNYYFLTRDVVSLYTLTGLHVAMAEYDGKYPEEYFDLTHEFDLNLGLGTNVELNSRWIAFNEFKYVTLRKQLGVLLGVKFNLKK